MSIHEELTNLKDRIESLERRNSELAGIASECGRQLGIVAKEGTQIAVELADVRRAAMTMLERAIESN